MGEFLKITQYSEFQVNFSKQILKSVLSRIVCSSYWHHSIGFALELHLTFTENRETNI